MTLTPLADRVLLKPIEVEETTKSGIILSSAAKEKSIISQVIAVGPGGMVNGKEVKMTLKVGDKVIIAKYAGHDVELDNQAYTLVNESDVLAVVED